MRQFFSIFARCTGYGLPQPGSKANAYLPSQQHGGCTSCVKIIGRGARVVCVSLYLTVWEEIFGFHVGLTMKRPFLVQLRRPFIFLIVMIKAKANGQKGSFAKVWTGPVVQVKSSMMALVWRSGVEATPPSSNYKRTQTAFVIWQ